MSNRGKQNRQIKEMPLKKKKILH